MDKQKKYEKEDKKKLYLKSNYNIIFKNYDWIKSKKYLNKNLESNENNINKMKLKNKKMTSAKIKKNISSKQILNINKSLNNSKIANFYKKKKSSSKKLLKNINFSTKILKPEPSKKKLNYKSKLITNKNSNKFNNFNFFKNGKKIPKIKKNDLKKINNYISQVKEKDKEVKLIINSKLNWKSSNYYLKNLEISLKSTTESYFNKIYKQHLSQTLASINFYKNLKNVKINIIEKSIKLPETNKITLIFDLDETLIHCIDNQYDKSDVKINIKFPSNEIVKVGINIRPYARELWQELSEHFQLVIFTASHKCYANPVINYLDPENKYISKRLFRENCTMVSNGFYIKDLRIFNKPLSRIILVDNSINSFIYQLENGIPIIPFYCHKKDKELISLKKFLLSIMNEPDIRPIIYSSFKWKLFIRNSKNYKNLTNMLFN